MVVTHPLLGVYYSWLLKVLIMPKWNKKSGGKASRKPRKKNTQPHSSDDEEDLGKLESLVGLGRSLGERTELA